MARCRGSLEKNAIRLFYGEQYGMIVEDRNDVRLEMINRINMINRI